MKWKFSSVSTRTTRRDLSSLSARVPTLFSFRTMPTNPNHTRQVNLRSDFRSSYRPSNSTSDSFSYGWVLLKSRSVKSHLVRSIPPYTLQLFCFPVIAMEYLPCFFALVWCFICCHGVGDTFFAQLVLLGAIKFHSIP